jgi:predicted CoA-binding protein
MSEILVTGFILGDDKAVVLASAHIPHPSFRIIKKLSMNGFEVS